MTSRWPGSSWASMSIGRCPASWAASTRIRSADGVDLPGEAVDRRGPRRSRSTLRSRPAGRRGCRSGRAGRRGRPRPTSRRAAPGCARRSLDAATAAGWSGARARWSARRRRPPGPVVRANWLIASVVFLVNTTTSRSWSAPTKCPTASRASSNAAVLSARLVSGSAMHAGGERQELLDGVDHRTQRRCRRRVVQVDITHHPPAEHRDELVHTDDVVSFHEPTVDDNRYPSATRRPEPAIRWRGADRLAGQLDVCRYSCQERRAQLLVVDQGGGGLHVDGAASAASAARGSAQSTRTCQHDR